jgi:hypothetical protein
MFKDKLGNLNSKGLLFCAISFLLVSTMIFGLLKQTYDYGGFKLPGFLQNNTQGVPSTSNKYANLTFQGINGGEYKLKSDFVRSLYEKDWNNLKFDVNHNSSLTLKNGDISYGSNKKAVKEILSTNCSDSPQSISPKILCFFETSSEGKSPFRSRKLYFTINKGENVLNLINYDMLNSTVDTRECQFTSAGDIACLNVNYNQANVYVYRKDGQGMNYKGMELMDGNPTLRMVGDFIVLSNGSGTYDTDGMYKIKVSTNNGLFQYAFTSSGPISKVVDKYLLTDNKCTNGLGDCVQLITFSGSDPRIEKEYNVGTCTGTPVVYSSFDNIFISQCNHTFSVNIRNYNDYKQYDFTGILDGYSTVKLFGVVGNNLIVTTNVSEGTLTLPTTRDYMYVVASDKLDCIKNYCSYNKSSLSLQPLIKTYSTNIKDYIFGAVTGENKIFIYDLKVDRYYYVNDIQSPHIIGVNNVDGPYLLVESDSKYLTVDLRKGEVIMKDIPKDDVQYNNI